MHNPNCPNCLNWSTFSFPRCLPSLRIAQIRNFWQIRDQWNTDKWFRPVSGGSWYEHPLQEIWRVHAGHLHSYLHWFQSHLLMLCQVSMGVQKIFLNPIPLDILRFRVKTMPQIKGKWQGGSNWHPLEGLLRRWWSMIDFVSLKYDYWLYHVLVKSHSGNNKQFFQFKFNIAIFFSSQIHKNSLTLEFMESFILISICYLLTIHCNCPHEIGCLNI